MPTIKLVDNEIELHAPFNYDLIEKCRFVKQLYSETYWDKEKSCWIFPLASAKMVVEMFSNYKIGNLHKEKFEIDEKLLDLIK